MDSLFDDSMHDEDAGEEIRTRITQGHARMQAWCDTEFIPKVMHPEFSAQQIIEWLTDDTLGYERFVYGEPLGGPGVFYASALDEKYHDDAVSLIMDLELGEAHDEVIKRLAHRTERALLSVDTVLQSKDPVRVMHGLLSLAEYVTNTSGQVLYKVFARPDFPPILEPKLLGLMSERQTNGLDVLWRRLITHKEFPRLSAEKFNEVYFRPFSGSVSSEEHAERLGREGMLNYIKYLYEHFEQNEKARLSLVARIVGLIRTSVLSGTSFETVWHEFHQRFPKGFAGAINVKNNTEVYTKTDLCPGEYCCLLRIWLHRFAERNNWSHEARTIIMQDVYITPLQD